METLFSNNKSVFAEVILPLPLPKTYTYEVPADLIDLAKTGARAIVQFGRKRIVTGIIASLHYNAPEIYEAKELLEILDEEPVINSRQMQLYQWMADYYMCNPGEVINTALPSGLKINSESKIQLNPEVKINYEELSAKEELLITALKAKESLSYLDASKILGQKNIHPVLKTLTAKNLIILFEELKEKYSPKIIRKIRLSDSYNNKERLEEVFDQLAKKAKQEEVLLKYLQQVPVYTSPELNHKGIDKSLLLSSISSSALSSLIKKGIMEEFEVVIPRFDFEGEKNIPEIQLTKDQLRARNELIEVLKEKDVALLFGVTGSGKTEVFIEMIRQALQGGSQVLYLLPEIALTTQIVTRLQKIFGNVMAVYHSKFSDNERVEVWKGLSSGKLNFVVGVRSSIFLPFDNLGLIIVDEEHETSYKQFDPAPRYHARDTALVLGRLHHAKTILGSATPSMESYYNANSGRWGLVKMEKRFGEAKLPEIVLINAREEKKRKRMRNDFTESLIEEIGKSLENKKQVILFQNRRGYAPFLYCEDCAHIPKCKNCAVSLTYHMYLNELRCHYCGHIENLPTTCEACGSTKIKTMGFGTEKLEEDLKLFFPEASVERMDLETTRKKNSYQKIIQEFEERKTDILVGTQMVSKGLDFDHVHLVAIFDPDRMIHFPDFRSHERAFQMMVQVSGRAGRRADIGKVLIQTNDPEQTLLKKVQTQDYETFYQEEIREREKFLYPPFSRLIRITVKDTDRAISRKASRHLADKLIMLFGKERVLGPEAPLIDKIRNYYLMEINIKLERNKLNLGQVKEKIKEEIRQLYTHKEFRNIQVIPDSDPY